MITAPPDGNVEEGPVGPDGVEARCFSQHGLAFIHSFIYDFFFGMPLDIQQTLIEVLIESTWVVLTDYITEF